MKPLPLLLFSCFLFSRSIAQDNRYIIPKIQQGPYRYGLPKELGPAILPDTSITLHNLSLLKGKKPGVYRLPQDNMPCIVPDSTRTVRIPNSWKGPVRVPYQGNPPRIPNPLSKKWVPTPITNTDSNTR